VPAAAEIKAALNCFADATRLEALT
jgi:hypothetical protein